MQVCRFKHGLSNKAIFQACFRRYSNAAVNSKPTGNVESELIKDNQSKQYQWKGWKWNVGRDWKITASVIAVITSYYVSTKLDRIKLKKQMRLDQVESQIQKLYGPLYGNRLVSQTSYRAVMKQHNGLQKYLKEARLSKDADMIRRWRSYVMDVLYPLDKAAVELIINNAHLIAHGGFPEEFKDLLVHTARMEFVMQHWKSDDGTLEPTSEFTEDDYLESNNSSGMRGRSRALLYAQEKYDELREEQKELSLQIGDYQQTDSIFFTVFRKMFR